MTISLSDSPDLPREASPQRLERIITLVRDEPLQRKTIIDRLGVNDDAGYDTIRLGIGLNFLQPTDRGITPTPLGEQTQDPDTRQSAYQQGLAEHEDYATILRLLSDRNLLHSGPLERATVNTLLKEELDVDMSKNTLSERVNTLLRTFEAAGLGDFVSGKPNTVAHFNFTTEFKPILADIIGDDTQPTQTDPDHPLNVQTTLPGTDTTPEINTTDPSDSQFQISFQLDKEMTPDDIEEAVVAIRRGLRQDLEEHTTE